MKTLSPLLKELAFTPVEGSTVKDWVKMIMTVTNHFSDCPKNLLNAANHLVVLKVDISFELGHLAIQSALDQQVVLSTVYELTSL